MTTFTPAICTQCGSNIEVDPKLEAAICKYCGTPFIVSKAIEKYSIQSIGTMNVSNSVIQMGPSSENLALRGKEFEDAREYLKAEEYYNKTAKDGIERIKFIKETVAIFFEGQEFERANRLRDAKACYQRALDRFPSDKGFVEAMKNIDDLIDKKSRISFPSAALLPLVKNGGLIVPKRGVFELNPQRILFTAHNGGQSILIPSSSINDLIPVLDGYYSNTYSGRYNAIRVLYDDSGKKRKIAFKAPDPVKNIERIRMILNGIY